MKKILIGTLISIFSFSASLRAQEAVPLSLQEALDAALKNNKEIALAELDEQGAYMRFRETDAALLPSIDLSYSAMSSNNPLHAFGFKLQQQSIGESDFNPSILNSPSATQNFMTKAEWQQPLVNMDMLYMRKAAHQQRQVFAFKTKRVKEYLVFEVTKAYAQLGLAYQAHAVLTEAAEAINSIYTVISNRYTKGFLQKSDLLQAQVQVTSAQNKMAEAKSNLKNASDYLSLLMGSKTDAVYSVESIIGTPILAEEIDENLPDRRADLQAMQSAIDAQNMLISSTKLSVVPKLNAFAQYLINDDDAFGFASNAYLVGAQLTWRLFNGMSVRNKVAGQRIERDKMAMQLSYEKEQSQLEVNKTYRQLQDAKFALQQQASAVDQASEALRILQNRYQQGLATTSDLLQAQTLLSQQKLSQAQTFFQINTANAYLQFLTSTSEK